MPRTLVQALAFLLGLWLALLLWPVRAGAASAEPSDTAAYADLEAPFYEAVNRFRLSQHLIPLRRLPEMDRIARAHSEDMARRSYLSHVSPEGRNPVDRLHAGGVSGFTLAAENAGMTSRSRSQQRDLPGLAALGRPPPQPGGAALQRHRRRDRARRRRNLLLHAALHHAAALSRPGRGAAKRSRCGVRAAASR